MDLDKLLKELEKLREVMKYAVDKKAEVLIGDEENTISQVQLIFDTEKETYTVRIF